MAADTFPESGARVSRRCVGRLSEGPCRWVGPLLYAAARRRSGSGRGRGPPARQCGQTLTGPLADPGLAPADLLGPGQILAGASDTAPPTVPSVRVLPSPTGHAVKADAAVGAAHPAALKKLQLQAVHDGDVADQAALGRHDGRRPAQRRPGHRRPGAGGRPGRAAGDLRPPRPAPSSPMRGNGWRASTPTSTTDSCGPLGNDELTNQDRLSKVTSSSTGCPKDGG